ncbi:MAG: CDGSH iron-sulfur domain-containing protein [Pseudomonadota bacterium]
MTDLPKISPADNGPLIVENPPLITGSDGAEVETGPKAALCRCGLSAKKPFCDGSHNQAGFDSTPDHSKLRNTPMEVTGTVEGVEVGISYTPAICTHAAKCQAHAAAVFDPKQRPWIQPEKGRLAEIVEAVATCPSGALRISLGDVPGQHMTTGTVGIEIEKDGPYHVTNVSLDAEFNGAEASRTKYSLCRCGLSKNKPFCDGTHYDKKWSDSQTA